LREKGREKQKRKKSFFSKEGPSSQKNVRRVAQKTWGEGASFLVPLEKHRNDCKKEPSPEIWTPRETEKGKKWQ